MLPRRVLATQLLLVGLLLVPQEAAFAQPPVEQERAPRSSTSDLLDYVRSTIWKIVQIGLQGAAARQSPEFDEHVLEKERTRLLVELLPLDRDNDRTISAAEFEQALGSVPAEDKARYETIRSEADANKDGAIDLTEIAKYAEIRVITARDRARNDDRSTRMTFDTDGNRRFDPEELAAKIKAEAEKAARKADALEHIQSKLGAPSHCAAPIPDGEADIVLLSGFSGSALSTVSVAGLNQATTVATIHIEAGDHRPLYILATAYDPTIWKLSGAVERIAKFVVVPANTEAGAGAGVVGVPPDRVVFTNSDTCISYFKSPDARPAEIAAEKMAAHFGRDIDHVVAQFQLHGVSIPSSSAKPGSEGYNEPAFNIPRADPDSHSNDAADTLTLSDLRRRYPAGLIEIAADDVVAPMPVQEYDVLPRQAGLVQLMREGAIRRVDIEDHRGYFRIERPIPRFPSGLYGSNSVRFILAKGVSMPAGNPGHSSVTLEETGECIGEQGCPR